MPLLLAMGLGAAGTMWLTRPFSDRPIVSDRAAALAIGVTALGVLAHRKGVI